MVSEKEGGEGSTGCEDEKAGPGSVDVEGPDSWDDSGPGSVDVEGPESWDDWS